jgi:hypothetical protein
MDADELCQIIAEKDDEIAALEATVREMRALLSKTRNSFGYIVSAIEDEGDRAYFGSTNDADALRTLRDEFENAIFSSETPVREPVRIAEPAK